MEALVAGAAVIALIGFVGVLLWSILQRFFPDAAKGSPPDFWERL